MIVIIDNGSGAADISRLVRNSGIVKSNLIPPSDAYILSDGAFDAKNQLLLKFIKSCKKPLLGIGTGYLYLGAAFGAVVKNGGCDRIEKVTIKQRSPILLNLKKVFSVNDSQKNILDSIPDDFGIIASSGKNECEVVQHGANPENPIDALPFFGVHFNPEAGLDGIQVLRNFERFVSIWNKYH